PAAVPDEQRQPCAVYPGADGGLVTWLRSLLRNRAAAREPVLTALKEDSTLDVKALPVVLMINGKNSGKTCW
ncbi:hypothetical protein JRU20_004863, partial [Salmonella enterica]|nr:hypothetical protein [Salmonella enterica]